MAGKDVAYTPKKKKKREPETALDAAGQIE